MFSKKSQPPSLPLVIGVSAISTIAGICLTATLACTYFNNLTTGLEERLGMRILSLQGQVGALRMEIEEAKSAPASTEAKAMQEAPETQQAPKSPSSTNPTKPSPLKKTSEDRLSVSYSGTATVSGTYKEYNPGDLLGGILCFEADEKTGYIVPRDPNLYGPGIGDERIPWFCFKDQEQAKKLFGVNDEKIFGEDGMSCLYGKATVQISHYTVTKAETAAADSATLEKIVSMQPFSTETQATASKCQ